jgi:beta-galactosidase/beta-glucuronidase
LLTVKNGNPTYFSEGSTAMNNLVSRPEYPRPQLVREEWINLNGSWEFEMDFGRTGRGRGLHQADRLSQSIIVPFCPESTLSGIGYTDFMPAVWYRRTFALPKDWAGKRIVLHFGAVDYETEVWVNGVSAGLHRGGYSSFQFDITELVREGDNVIAVCAEDDVRTGLQPGGKQSGKYHSYNCYYTRTTGIWQTVWLECVPDFHIESYRVVTDPANAQANLAIRFKGGYRKGVSLRIDAFYDGKLAGSRTAQISSHQLHTQVSLNEVHLWEPGHGRLYDLIFTLE